MNPLVSILIPAKNESRFIEECLLSIQAQTYKYWEVIVVDDHSTDETDELVAQFAKNDERIRMMKNRGEEIIPALQMAYISAKGDFITRMDADDRMRSHKLETLVNSLHENGRGFVAVGGVHYFAEEELKSGYKNYQNWLNDHTAKGTNFTDIFKECVIPSPCWMLYKEDLDLIGAFDSNYYPEDYDLAFRMYQHGFQVVPCTEILHDWRDYSTRTSRTSDHYKEYTFTAIKWRYFNKLHRDNSKQLVLMGTGYRGKKLATLLIENNISFAWISNNSEKIGKHIYDQLILDFNAPIQWENTQSILTIVNAKGKEAIAGFLEPFGLKRNVDFFHFC